MSYEEQLFDEVIYDAAGKMSPNDAADLLEWVESLEVAKRKADEYESKATAFDEIFKLYIGYEDGWINFPRGKRSFNKAVINVCKYYESGESDAKK